MIVKCGACLIEQDVLKLGTGSSLKLVGAEFNLKLVASGFSLQLEGTWRVRNAAVNDAGLPGPCAVFLCSEICEQRYGREVGFLEEAV